MAFSYVLVSFQKSNKPKANQTPKPHTEVLHLPNTTEAKLQRWGVKPAPGR